MPVRLFQPWRTVLAFGAGLAALAGLACSSGTAAPTPVPPTSSPAPQTPVPISTIVPAVAETPEPPQPAAEQDGQLSTVFSELNPSGPKEFNRSEFRQLLRRDVIMPIYKPLVETPSDELIHPMDLVIDVTIGGESRAYPIRVLRIREMANDVLGGTPILVTW